MHAWVSANFGDLQIVGELTNDWLFLEEIMGLGIDPLYGWQLINCLGEVLQKQTSKEIWVNFTQLNALVAVAAADIYEKRFLGRLWRSERNLVGLGGEQFKADSPFRTFEGAHELLQGAEMLGMLNEPIKAAQLRFKRFLERGVRVAGNVLVVVFCKEIRRCLDGWTERVET